MTSYDFDLIVIGAGSGGVRMSRTSAAMGAEVAIIENMRTGGTCVMRGCVPKKLLVYGSTFSDAFKDSKGFGWTSKPASFSWPDLIKAKDEELARLEIVYNKLLRSFRFNIFGPSLNALSGSLCVSRKIPATPIETAALHNEGINSLLPPLLLPNKPGCCTECVPS